MFVFTGEDWSMSSAQLPTQTIPPGPAEYALLAGISLTWGTSYMFTKIALDAVGPLSLIALRTLIAAIAMLLFTAMRGGMRLTFQEMSALAIVGLLSNAAPLSLIAVSVSYVESSATATTMALVPLITALLATFRGEHPTLREFLGIVLGFVGIIVLFGPGTLASLGDSARGAIAAVAAALVFSVSLFVMRLVRHHHPMTVTTTSLTFAALWTVPTAFFIEGLPQALPGGGVIGAVLTLALLNTAASSILLFALVPRAGATFTSYNNYLVPVVAVLCGWVFLGESITVQRTAGVVLILSGVAISTLKSRAPVEARPIRPA
jgi:drug/metabolite transporter (DMT)-like permease